MPTSHHADTCRTADGSAPSAGHAEKTRTGGVYLTDEVFLYRIVRVVAGAAAEMVELEDCFLLDIVRVPLADLRARRLRVVADPLRSGTGRRASVSPFRAAAARGG